MKNVNITDKPYFSPRFDVVEILSGCVIAQSMVDPDELGPEEEDIL